ncbi:hypothetical protein Mpt1_c03640 [Candidatus Methanoplasma termitum]|uniref:Uncharacterized protein n=1 Tax=Candidatus Methanoplasma termitum TaxID=1577791 RepID=A0A0A7LB08_9ARCH|nr:hypothetical protein [Candidatus Methanoplasma termitum]AIZ56259.1 hypothetical protein Mpt1_c03640 [Candidatus Methanoplasma termitum]
MYDDEELPGSSQYIQDDEASSDPLYIHDDEEYQRLKISLSEGRPLSELDIVRLSVTLKARFMENINVEGDTVAARSLLDMLFMCFRVLPGSDVVQGKFSTAVFVYILEAGELGEIDTALEYISRFQRALAAGPYNQSLSRTCMNVMVRTIENILQSDDSSISEARALYKKLEAATEPHMEDPVMPGLIAKAKRLFMVDVQKYPAQLKELRSLLSIYSDNALVACEYARACEVCFTEYLGDPAYKKVRDELLSELERIRDTYREPYRAFMESEEDYSFIGCHLNLPDLCFTNSIAEAAAYHTKKGSLEDLQDLQRRLQAAQPPLYAEYLYRSVERQVLSNLAFLYGNKKDWTKAEDSVDRLKKLVWSPSEPEEAGDPENASAAWLGNQRKNIDQMGPNSLSDALFNLITDYVNDDPAAHREKVQAALVELEDLALATDRVYQHKSYAAALNNISLQTEKSGVPHMPVWDRLYSYAMEHDVGNEMAELIAEEERTLANQPKDLKTGKFYHDRLSDLAGNPSYRRNGNVQVHLAVGKYNLSHIASSAGDMKLAEEMFAGLITMAEESAYNKGTQREIVLRLAKGGYNLSLDYGNNGELALSLAVYSKMVPILLPFQDDTEIANCLVNTAFNLYVDLKKAGQEQKIRELYDEVKGANVNGDAAVRLSKLKKAAGA